MGHVVPKAINNLGKQGSWVEEFGTPDARNFTPVRQSDAGAELKTFPRARKRANAAG
jgi:hypothetical protein